MRNAVIGLIIGIVAGIVLGTTVIAPRLAKSVSGAIALTPAVEDTVDPSADKDGANPTPSDTAVTTATAPAAAPKATSPEKKITRLRMASAFAESLKVHGTSAKRLERTVWRISDGQLDLRFFTWSPTKTRWRQSRQVRLMRILPLWKPLPSANRR